MAQSTMIAIVMGVAGAGKSTIGKMLAASLGWDFHDADDLHSDAHRLKMSRGIALTDEDRGPWLRTIRKLVEDHLATGRSAVIACSALKQAYRKEIVIDPQAVRVVYLRGSEELIRERLRSRAGHFMNPALIQSQFETLEEPDDAIVVDIAMAPEAIVQEVRKQLGR